MVNGRISRQVGKWAAALALALTALSAFALPAAAQDMPPVISPLRVETDPNGLNLVDGKIQVQVPVLSVPAAPNLRFDRVQNATPYVEGVHTPGSDPMHNTFSIHTGTGTSESFDCLDVVCTSVTGSGSTLSASGRTFRQAGTGIVYNFSFTTENWSSTNNKMHFHASSVAYPNGEVISYTYDPVVQAGTPVTRTYYRPIKLRSNMGFYITITYQGNDFTGSPENWMTVREATLYSEADPSTPLGRLTYSNYGYTIVDHGSRAANDPDGRTFLCEGCENMLSSDLERPGGTMRLPGEASYAMQALQSATGGVIGSIVRDGVAWNYSYANQSYDAIGRTQIYSSLTATGPNGYHVVYTFNQANHRNVIDTVTDSLNRVTNYDFDTSFRPTRVVYPEGNQVTVHYDANGNVDLRTTIAKPNSGLANLTESALYPAPPPDGPCEGVLCYRPIWARDALNRQTDFVYNTRGQLIEQTDPADQNGYRRKTYNEYVTSPVVAVTGGNLGGISRREVVRVCGFNATCGTTNEIRTEYDYWGETLLPAAERHIDAARGITRETTYTYDSAGRPLVVDGPLAGTGDATYYRYDVYGRRTWEIGPLGANGVRNAQHFTYRDSDDKVTRTERGTVTDPNAATLAFTQLLDQTDLVYDSHRNPARESVSSGGITQTVLQRTFQDSGRLDCEAQRMNPSIFASLPASACTLGAPGTGTNDFGPDRITHNVYDNAGQLTQVQRAYGITTAAGFPATLQQNYATYTYSPNGHRLSVTDANGNRAEMTYDGYDRQRRWIFPSATTDGVANPADYEEYTYDAAGNRLTLRKRDGSILSYQYDNLNRLIRKTVPERTGLAATHTRDVFYDYDFQNLQTYARFDSRLTTADGVTNTYDALGQLRSSALRMDGVVRTVSSNYNIAGDRTQITHPDGQVFTYLFDNAARLSDIYEGSTTTVMLDHFTYNTRGLPASRTERYGSGVAYTYDPIGRLGSLADTFVGGIGNVTLGYGYNPASQIVSRSRSNDAYAWTEGVDVSRSYTVNGLNQYTAAGPASFTYDANGNLTSDGSTTFTYDVENRLVTASGARTATLRYDPLGRLYEVASPTGTTQRFTYDGDALVTVNNASNGGLLERYVHGSSAGDDPLVWYHVGAARALHSDHQGSIVAVTGSSTGSVASFNAYDEWGIPNATNAGRFQYTGQAWINELGLYYYKARMYSPTLGRFMQVDPVGYNGGINLYGYVGNDPLNQVDSTGLATDEQIRAAQRTLNRLVGAIRQEIQKSRQPASGSRLQSNSDASREAGLRNQLARLQALRAEDLADMIVNPPNAAVGSGLTNAMVGSRAETLYGATNSGGSVTFGRTGQNTQTSDSARASVDTSNLLALGHPHGAGSGRAFPGIGDPGNVVISRVPMLYSVDGNSNAIGWNGSRFTLSSVQGTLPSYNSAPGWIRDTFEPW